MRISIFILALLFSIPLSAQQVQWASKVIKASSYFQKRNFPGQLSPKQALGPPSMTYPAKLHPCAWTPATQASAKGEFIVLEFENPQQVQQIVICENLGAGAVSRIKLKDTEGGIHEVFAEPMPGRVKDSSRVWNLIIPKTTYLVNLIRIDLNTKSVPGFNQIDAVGISESSEPIKVGINIAKEVELLGKIEHLGAGVNSTGAELCPVISPDGKTLYFTRMYHKGNIDFEAQDIWYSELNEAGQLSEAINMGKPMNNGYNNSLTSITPDGQTALLLNAYLPNGEMEAGISLARKSEDGWSQPVPVEMDDYYNHNIYGEYCLSSSGKVMLLAAQRNDSEGSKDLYVSFRKGYLKWTRPQSIGMNVNTAGSETSPFLAADDKTLYFSTDGLPGHGAHDMYVTRRLDDTWTNWSDPENLGPQLNTSDWDAYYSVPASGEYVYFVSYKDGGFGNADIYRAPLPPSLRPDPVVLVRGIVTDKETGQPLGTEISIVSLTTEEEIGVARSNPKTGKYSIVLPAGDQYGFSAEKENYLPVSDHLDLTELKVYKEVRKDLELPPMKAGASIVLNNIYFDLAKYELRSESYVELKTMKRIMDQFPSLKAEVSGHTDNIGNPQSNQVLSLNRAKSVRGYLISLGIAEDRLQIKGYGETAPLVPNDSEDNRQINRRVEFSILSM